MMLDIRAKQKSLQGDPVQGEGVGGEEPFVRWSLGGRGGGEKGGERAEEGGSG